MRIRAQWFAAGLAVAIAAGALAVTGGGFPSRPMFQQVTVGPAPVTSSLRNVLVNVVGGDGRLGVATTTSGNAYLDLDTVGVANWVIGNRRSDGHFVISNAQDFSVVAMDIPPGGTVLPSPIKCTAACTATGMVVGQSAQVVKTGSTSRANTAVVANDPDLQFSLSNGTYRIEIHAEWTNGSTGGFSWSETASGGVQVVGVVACTGGTASIAPQIDSSTCSGSLGGALTVSGEAVVSGIATVAFQWAQQTSNATNTTVGPNSYITVTRLN